MGAILDHLWQSTLFAVVAAVLAWSLRRYHARVRYVVWLVASVKFLVPYTILTAAARLMPWPSAHVVVPISTTVFLDTADAVTTPFSGTPRIAAAVVATAPSSKLPLVFALIWAAGTLALAVRWFVIARRLRRTRISLRPESPRECEVLARIAAQTAAAGVDVVLIESTIEPGVAGVFRPALFWPRGISDRLTNEQVDAVVAHEMAHVRWHDNAATMLHMAVEALFWCHPLVWWLGARLVDERERGCDEAVLRAGGARHAYAEGILRICEFHVSSPLTCVAGVTGSNLKRRISTIMRGEVGRSFPTAMRWALASVLIAFVVVPIGVGAGRQVAASASSPEPNLVRFEVASIKPNTVSNSSGSSGLRPGGLYRIVNGSVAGLIRQAFGGDQPLHDSQVVGVPDWASSLRYDITAKAPSPTVTRAEARAMLQALLADRFTLRAHHETRDQPVYALVKSRTDGRLGTQIRPSTMDCDAVHRARDAGTPLPTNVPADRPACGYRMLGNQAGLTLTGGGVTLAGLATALAVDRIVIDQTGLAGMFDVDLQWDVPTGGTDDRKSVFTAVQEQLGLRLEATRAPVDVLIVDHIERPTTN